MARQLRLLDQVHIAAPCPLDWEKMSGNDRVRHCLECRHNVYNLSEMTEKEAEHLIQTHEGRLCIRIYRREDGKVMTKDCSRGLRALRMRAVRRLALAASFALMAIGCGEQGEKIKQAYGLDKFEKSSPPTGKVVMGQEVGMFYVSPPPPLLIPIVKTPSKKK